MDFTIPTPTTAEPPTTSTLIKTLALDPHPEGGYYKLTQTHPSSVPISAFSNKPPIFDPKKITGETRAACTSIYYFLSPKSPIGHFHRNKSVIIHSLHRGRGRYVLIRPDGKVESFVVGKRVEKGERCMWVVDGGVWKASFFEEDADEQENEGGLLITEVVVPGFDYKDHDFLAVSDLVKLVGEEKAEHLVKLCKK